MNKIEKQQAINDLKSIIKMIEETEADPSSCGNCMYCEKNRCTIPDPSMDIPPKVYKIGCNKWEWDGLPF